MSRSSIRGQNQEQQDHGQWQQSIKQGAVTFTDNQAALRAIQNPRMPSGQGHLEGCLGLLEWCTSEGIQVELRRILAHESIPSNETADDLTKEAATSPEAKPGSTSNSNSTRRSPVLPSTPAPEETLPCWNLPPNTESIEEGVFTVHEIQ
ncbi:hypothetical protein N7535_008109 [Penicillium sp. DV-2018c]|nr:hypothetical protein N7535_008109 [Penicillium sp. DV-2018c]